MDQYIPPDARILDADTDYKALAAQDPVWTPPPPQLRSLRANRREFIKGVIASGTAVSAVSYTMGARSAHAQNAAAPERLMAVNINGQTRLLDADPCAAGPQGHDHRGAGRP